MRCDSTQRGQTKLVSWNHTHNASYEVDKPTKFRIDKDAQNEAHGYDYMIPL